MAGRLKRRDLCRCKYFLLREFSDGAGVFSRGGEVFAVFTFIALRSKYKLEALFYDQ